MLRALRHAAADIPFSREDANRFLPWILACMICLTCMYLLIGASLNLGLVRWQAQYANSYIIQVPFVEKGMAERVEQVKTVVEQVPGVSKVTPVENATLRQLMQPWLGDTELLNVLPMPQLLEVEGKPGELDVNHLASMVNAIDGKIELDGHERWLRNFATLMNAVQWVAFGFALLLVGTTLAVVVLSTRMSLRLHQRTVRILHSIGAVDDYIARQFQSNMTWVALKAAGAGALLAALLFAVLIAMEPSIESPLIPQLSFHWWHAIVLTGLPLFVVLLSAVSARISAQTLLKRLH
jgi:cell division transport system permease protein